MREFSTNVKFSPYLSTLFELYKDYGLRHTTIARFVAHILSESLILFGSRCLLLPFLFTGLR